MSRSATLFALLAAVAAFVTGAAVAAAPAQVTPPRALWVWNTSDLRHDPEAANTFFRFLAAPHDRTDRAITTLYFDGMSPSDFAQTETAQELRKFLVAAHQRRLRVEFLCGDPAWAKAENHAEALSNLKAVLDFNKNGKPDERFDGFQYDVEPYILKEWPSETLTRDFLALLDKARDEIKASKSKLIIGAAIPRFFHNELTGHLDRKVLDRVDYIALMDYVDSSERLITDAAPEIEYAGKIGKKVWIGVETQELKDEPRATFYALGNDTMEKAFTAAAEHYKKAPGFGGFAIHHWASYRVFKQK
jgi:hypothetical protein